MVIYHIFFSQTIKISKDLLFLITFEVDRKHMANLFEEDAKIPLPQAYADNLVQIYPKHGTHGTVPTAQINFFNIRDYVKLMAYRNK